MTTTGPQRIVVAINPTASFGARRTVGPAVTSALRSAGHDVVELVEPTGAALAAAARITLANGADALVVVGGDGMVSLGTNLVAGTGIPLGIVPSGTGNDVARGLGLPIGDTTAAITALLDALKHPPRIIDAVQVSRGDEAPVWFAGVLSAGFDAIVNERANSLRFPRGKHRYTLSILVELIRLTPINYRLVLDGDQIETAALLVSVGNNVSIGGGMRVTPDALLDDGLLDVMVVRPLSRLSFLRIFPRVFAGTHTTDPRVSIRRATRVRIEADAVVAYADGERIGALPVDIVLQPGALAVLATARHPL